MLDSGPCIGRDCVYCAFAVYLPVLHLFFHSSTFPFLSHSPLHLPTSPSPIFTNPYQNRFPAKNLLFTSSTSPSAPSTTIPSSLLTGTSIGEAMIRRIIRISALTRAGRGRGIRDLVASKGRCILGSSARGVRVALSGVLYSVDRLLTATIKIPIQQYAEMRWLE